ncbi:MAG: LPS export ABC transporter periplasmic protein LptC [Gammaproteobacteria bacterium]
MFNRWKIAILLVTVATGSAWLLNWLGEDKTTSTTLLRHDPDHYMKNFTTLTMEENGKPKSKLYADYMAHYPDDNTTELIKPKLVVYRENKSPVNIIADKGWVTADNEVILLSGSVTLWQENNAGERELEIISSDVKILTEQQYAETDKPTTIKARKNTFKSIGARAYFQENRLELLNNVHGKIPPN